MKQERNRQKRFLEERASHYAKNDLFDYDYDYDHDSDSDTDLFFHKAKMLLIIKSGSIDK